MTVDQVWINELVSVEDACTLLKITEEDATKMKNEMDTETILTLLEIGFEILATSSAIQELAGEKNVIESDNIVKESDIHTGVL